MKLINRDTDNAVQALLFMARSENDRVSVTELASDLDISYPFLRKILQTLSQEGIVNSFKGKGGGFELSIPPKEIFLADLIGIFQGPVDLTNCRRNDGPCPDLGTCPLRRKISGLQRNLAKELESTSLAALLEEDISCDGGVSNAVT